MRTPTLDSLSERCKAMGVQFDDWLHRHEGAPTIQLGKRGEGHIVLNLSTGRFSGNFAGQEFSSDCAYGESRFQWFWNVQRFLNEPSAPWPFLESAS